MKPAIFLDRDGTIIKDKGNIGSADKVEFYSYTFDCLRRLEKNYLLFIITNQPGISQGVLRKEQVENVHYYIKLVLKQNKINIQEIYYCPHHKNDNCKCRKPNTYFINKAKKNYPIDLKYSFVIGDHLSDVELAINSKAKGIYLLTGHGNKHLVDIPKEVRENITICRNLKSATDLILKTLYTVGER
ncbi:MAG: HAD family hydrolase [Ignavibacteriales bacterium]|nr:HAD family hydrolase [Ignavibacteriales bacterium]